MEYLILISILVIAAWAYNFEYVITQPVIKRVDPSYNRCMKMAEEATDKLIAEMNSKKVS